MSLPSIEKPKERFAPMLTSKSTFDFFPFGVEIDERTINEFILQLFLLFLPFWPGKGESFKFEWDK